jgi:hypothetical protein
MLNGSLDTVALPDVLRLIASSAKSGLLRVEDASPSGRIFIVDGRVAFATTRNEDDPIDDLLHMEYRADYVGSSEDRRIVDLSDLLENNPEAFNRFLEQMVVEVMSRLVRVNEGRFRFDVDIRSRREIPHSFDVEDMISQASARSTAWTQIFEVVPSASAPFRMAPRLSEAEEVALARRDWALLAATGSSTSIDEIAQKLKIFEFAAAKKVAELTQRGLIEFINTEVSQTSLAATELLSEVFEVEGVGVDNEVVASPPVESPIDSEPEEITLEELPETEAAPEEEQEAEADGPTWLPVENEAEDDDDPVPLLEELHRLHEAEAAASEAGDDEAEPDEALLEEEDPDLDIDDIEGGDLATRWKNLRKAKRGAHASNE